MEAIFAEHPDWKILSKHKLLQTLKLHGMKVGKKVVDEYFSTHALHQVYKRPNKPRLLFKINSMPYSYQIDIVVLPQFSVANRGTYRFLLCVEILSKKAFAYVLKSNKMCHVCEAHNLFLIECNSIRTCFVYGDAFFNNTDFIAMNRAKHIKVSTCVAKMEHLTKHGGNKLGVVDRMTRTIKSLIQKHMSTTGDARWPTYLRNMISMYNDTPHATLGGTTPNAAFDDFWRLQGIYRDNKKYNDELRDSASSMLSTMCLGISTLVCLAETCSTLWKASDTSLTVMQIRATTNTGATLITYA